MSALEKKNNNQAEKIEQVLMAGDLAKLSAEERVSYYRMVCESVGLNPLTRPLEYITLNGKLTLYARKDCTDQLRNVNQVSVKIVAREVVDDCYVVTAEAILPNGRTDSSIGAVSIGGLKGEQKCNAMMKAETKSKRRVTLSICGMGLLDETEIETIPAASLKEVKTIERDVVIDDRPQKQLNSVEPSKDETAVEYSTKEQQDYMLMRFKDSLPLKHRTKSDELRRAWLKERGYVDDKGNGTSKAIPRNLFTEVCKDSIKYAKSLGADNA